MFASLALRVSVFPRAFPVGDERKSKIRNVKNQRRGITMLRSWLLVRVKRRNFLLHDGGAGNPLPQKIEETASHDMA